MKYAESNRPERSTSIHESLWVSSITKDSYPSLKKDISVDVAIIGGGIVGITTGFLLKRRGLNVAILEADQILQGTTGHTTAKITSQHGLIYDKLTRKLGCDYAKQYADANESAIRFIADLIDEKNMDCDFCRRPAYVYTQSEDYIVKIEDETKAAAKLGIKAAFMDEIPLPFRVKAALRFEDQAQFHPLRYLMELVRDIPGGGSSIFEHTKAIDISDGVNCEVKTWSGNKVTASKVVIASHFPCYDGLGFYFARMYAEKSYVLGVKIKDKFSEGMFISAEDPGRSLRAQKWEQDEILLVGGEHHKTGSHSDTNKHYENLLKFSKENFQVESILYRWSTQDCMTADGIPYTGYLTSRTSNILVATGFGKWGMTNGTASAMLLADLITKGDSAWKEVYNPSRTDLSASALNLLKQNVDVAVKFVSGKLAPIPKDVELNEGEAKKMNLEGQSVGAYRDEQGVLHAVDVTCTHLGCELEWNEAEKTWDCPCHGSRFSYTGDNVEGPAFNPLRHQGDGANQKDPNLF